MLFQTFDYAIFFAIVVICVFVLKGKAQKIFLLLASMFFYAYGSLIQLPLFAGVILWTYILARIVDKNKSKVILAIGLVITFMPLFFCKYVPFLYSQFSNNAISILLKITLPVGISFYTFQATGYVIDVWRNKEEAEKSLLSYALFLSFFPQLIAGPIERSGNLMKQIKKITTFDYDNVVSGLRLMGLGLFLKIFVADRIAVVVEYAYDTISVASGTLLFIATLLFGIQIYCDFNGYSTIARGSAKVLGIDLMENFKRPYFSTSCTEFWRRWHISLSTWFKDYVYIPLGGNRCSKLRNSINLFITFVVSGIWHGANWTYAIWGGDKWPLSNS
jgi:D-alanyl-lipoteichoic acid acyltransferase DltB (MBOAT superfamily)